MNIETLINAINRDEETRQAFWEDIANMQQVYCAIRKDKDREFVNGQCFVWVSGICRLIEKAMESGEQQ